MNLPYLSVAPFTMGLDSCHGPFHVGILCQQSWIKNISTKRTMGLCQLTVLSQTVYTISEKQSKQQFVWNNIFHQLADKNAGLKRSNICFPIKWWKHSCDVTNLDWNQSPPSQSLVFLFGKWQRQKSHKESWALSSK